MFRVPFYIAVVLLTAFGLGIGGTLLSMQYTSANGAIDIGPWRAFPDAQTLEADPYTKAHRANSGRLLYGTAEGVTFTAQTDSDGNALDGSCDYKITGNIPAARFWTLYTADKKQPKAIAQDQRPTALNSRILLRDPQSGLDISLSNDAKPFNWLALQQEGPFVLVLSLLDTPIANSTGLSAIEMPQITKIGCGNA